MTDKEKTALFIGNRDCYQVKEADIEQAIINAIENGIEVFLNGGQGYFDKTCASIVHRLKKRYSHIKSILVIPYRDFKIFSDSLFDEIIYPLEEHTFSYYTYKSGSSKRNRWSVEHSSVVICFVYRSGGASKTLDYARREKQNNRLALKSIQNRMMYRYSQIKLRKMCCYFNCNIAFCDPL